MMKPWIAACLLLSGATELAAQPTEPILPRPGQPAIERRLGPIQRAVIQSRAANKLRLAKLAAGPRKPQAGVSGAVPGIIRDAVRKRIERKWLTSIQARKADPAFLGVIGSINLGGIEVALERRNVVTQKGLLPLVLTRMGDDYVYDGDMVVPKTAIAGVGLPPITAIPLNITFAAGVPSTFGPGALWDDAIIPFEVADDFCCDAALEAAIANYEASTVFRFEPRDGHQTYVRFVNAEPFTTSRTMLGKQNGQNEIKIAAGASTGNIEHEIAHELSLIHEHLRSDRDDFIARNPSCQPADIFQAIYEGWIDVGQVMFTDDQAELLTAYDFASLMHYSFQLDTDGDGFSNCNTWVRIATCANGNPAAPNCVANFSSGGLTGRDIEGLHKIYSQLAGTGLFLAEPGQVRIFTGDNLRHRGKRIDRCLHGAPLGVNGCSVQSRDRVADAFCQTRGFVNGFNVQYESLWGINSGFDATEGWKDVGGFDVLSAITCENLTDTADQVAAGTIVEEIFSGDEVRISGRAIDRCVWGDNIAGNRCSEANQRLVADNFCEAQDFTASSGFETAFGPNPFGTGYHPDDDVFRDISGVDIFTKITCVGNPS